MVNLQEQIQTYNALLKDYQALDREIDALLMEYGGHSENMPAEAMLRYRELANKRDELFNAVRELEQELSLDNAE